jgi:hypothetical protein
MLDLLNLLNLLLLCWLSIRHIFLLNSRILLSLRLFVDSYSPFPLSNILLFLWGVSWFFRLSHNIFRTLRFLLFSNLHLFI